MSQPFSIDPKGVLIDKLGESGLRFQVSCLFFKNARGLNALYEIRKMKSELLDFAKDPSLAGKQLGLHRPRMPDVAKMPQEDQPAAIEEYRELMEQYETAKIALQMQVPIPDMFAIDQFMEPFDDTIHATPAVKGRRFHAFTKEPTEQQSGLFGLGKKSANNMS